MPAFEVTTNPRTLPPLKPGEKVGIVVTATNRLRYAVTARAQKVVTPPAFDAMVKPPATPQGTFPHEGATYDFTFSIEIPADAQAGKFRTRFDVVDTEQPNDNFGQSSEVEAVIVVEEKEPPPPPKKKWWIWVVIAVVVVGVGIGIWRLVSNGHEMPDVVTMTFADAKAAIDIDSARLVRVDTLDLDTAAWHGDVVIRQAPAAGTSLEDTTKVRLVVQRPFSVVPTLMNLDGATAGARIGAAGFALGLASRCQTTASSQNGRVVQVRPPERTVQPRATTVTITLLTVQPSCLIIHFDSAMIHREWERERARVRVIVPNQ